MLAFFASYMIMMGNCTGVEEQKKEVPYSPEDKRAEFCPLIPVPEHGRLGDLDKLVEKIDGIWDCNDMVFKPNDHCCNIPEDCKGCKWVETKNFIRRMVANAQTIIPAEEDET